MKEKVFIAVDCGKYATKAILKNGGTSEIIIFRTKMQEVEQLGIEINPDSYYVQYNKKSFLIGEAVSETYSSFDLTKQIDLHKLCVYTAIAKLLQKANLQNKDIKIHLAVNIPISMYKDSKSKKEYKDFIENHNNPILISLNGDSFYFHLSDIIVVFEGVGVIYDEMEMVKNKYTTVIDIGGLNTTLCSFSGINPNFDSMTVSNLGINMMKGKIGRAINERYGIAVTANDLERIVQNGYFSHAGKINSDSQMLIDQIKHQHFKEIIEFAKSRDYTFNNVDMHFVGGGSQILRKNISEKFPHARIVVNPQFANVRSFLKILEVKYGQ